MVGRPFPPVCHTPDAARVNLIQPLAMRHLLPRESAARSRAKFDRGGGGLLHILAALNTVGYTL